MSKYSSPKLRNQDRRTRFSKSTEKKLKEQIQLEATLKKEELEWKKDLCCLLLQNLPKCWSSTSEGEVKLNKYIVYSILEQVANTESVVNISPCLNIVPWDKIPPIKVAFNSHKTAWEILQRKQNICHDTIVISAIENTVSQRKYIEHLNTQFRLRKENGELNLAIEHVDGIPKIVDKRIISRFPKKHMGRNKLHNELMAEISYQLMDMEDTLIND